jgi:hypothetical protein
MNDTPETVLLMRLGDQPQPAASDEVFKVTVGVPGIASAQIPIQRSLVTRIRAYFGREIPVSLIAVVMVRAHVSVTAEDDGSIDFWATIVNMSTEPITVDRLHLGLFLIGGISTNTPPPYLSPSRSPIQPRSTGEMHFRTVLGAPAIRQLKQYIQPAHNLYSTPRLEIKLAGVIDIKQNKKDLRVSFEVEDRSPVLYLNTESFRK